MGVKAARMGELAAAGMAAAVVLVVGAPSAMAAPDPGGTPVPGKSVPAGFPAGLQQYVAGTPQYAAAAWSTACAPGGPSTVPTSLSAAGGPPLNTAARAGGIDMGMYLTALTPVEAQLLWWSQADAQRGKWWAIHRMTAATFGVNYTSDAKMASVTPPSGMLGAVPAMATGHAPQYKTGFCSAELAKWAPAAANTLGFTWSPDLDAATQRWEKGRQPGLTYTETELHPCAADGQYCSMAYYVDCTKASRADLQSCATWNNIVDAELSQTSMWAAQHRSNWARIGSFFDGLFTASWHGGAAVVEGFAAVIAGGLAAAQAVIDFIKNPLGSFDEWVNELKADVISLIKGVLNGYNSASNWDVSSGAFLSRYAKMAALGIVLAAFMFLGGIRRAADSGDRAALQKLLGRLGKTFILILWGPLLFQLLATTATTATANMVDRWTGGEMGGAANKIIGLSSVTSTIPGGAFMGFVMFILMFLGACGLWVGLMLQRFGMEVGATLIPLVAGAYVHPRFKAKVEKAVWVVTGLILAKPVVMIVLGAAFGVINDGLSFNGTPLQVLAGLTIAMIGLVITGLSPFALIKWAPILPTSGDSHDHSSGSPMTGAAIGAAGTALAMSGGRGQGAGGGRAAAGQQNGTAELGAASTSGGGGALTKAYDNGLVGAGSQQSGGSSAPVNGTRPAAASATRAGGSAAATVGLSIAAQAAQAGLSKGRDLGRRHAPQADMPDEEGS